MATSRVWEVADWSADGGDEPPLAQGDLLASCLIPELPAGFDPVGDAGRPLDLEVEQRPLIVMTQSCDLAPANAGKGIDAVTLCRVDRLAAFADANPAFYARHVKSWKGWNGVRAGKYVSLHMLPCPDAPDESAAAFVVDFRRTASLPLDYLNRHAATLGARPRLLSPYLEHFSQAFARFFMRVGLPNETVPKFVGSGPDAAN